MKKILILPVLLFAGLNLTAQDLIITTSNDSINAKITKENKKGIYFNFMKNDEVRSTLLLHSQISGYKKSFFEIAEVSKNIKTPSDYDGERFRIALEAGVGYRLGKIQGELDPVVKDHVRKLRSGFHWGTDAHYFIIDQLALGIRYNSFYSSHTANNIQTTFADGSIEQGLVNEIKINFVGPSVLSRFLSANQRNALITLLALGYMNYSDTELAGARSFTTKGNTIGLTADLGYEVGLGNILSLGVSTSSMIGFLNKLTVEDNGNIQTINLKESGSKPESLGRLNLSIRLRAHF
jgi:hypothetical protein